ncbi:MAG: hypothetical protein KDA28_13130, partial [Phycisphaerales bacterium]|nr:hypothetical protein [Phycisphaerales bacterium]
MRHTATTSAIILAAGAAFAQDVHRLDTLGGATSIARDINELGQIVGSSSGPLGNAMQATIWNGGVPSGLGMASGTDFSFATGINDLGDVVGYSETGSVPGDGSNANTATWWGHDGTISDIGASMGLSFSRAFDVNNASNVAMQGNTLRGTGGYVWNPLMGGIQAGADPIYTFGGNRGINDRNNLAGWAQAGFDGGQAIFTLFNGAGWDVGIEVGPQAVIEPAWANAISDTNLVVGRAGDGRGHTSEAALFTLDPRDPVQWLGKIDG